MKTNNKKKPVSDTKPQKHSDIKKENQDLPNIPASSERVKTGKTAQKQIKKTSELHKDGHTENTEQNSNN